MNKTFDSWKDFCELMYLKYGRLGKQPTRAVVKNAVVQANKSGDLKCADYRCLRKYIGYYKKKQTKYHGTIAEWREGLLEEMSWIETFDDLTGARKVRRYIFPDPYAIMGAKAKPIPMKKIIESIKKDIEEESTSPLASPLDESRSYEVNAVKTHTVNS